MNTDNLSDLPEWDDDEFENEDKSEAWKRNETRAACKAMYLQWSTVMTVLKATLDSLNETGEEDPAMQETMKEHVDMIMDDVYGAAAKMKSSEVGVYVTRMENAAMIRMHAKFIKLSINSFMPDGVMEPQHRQVILDEINIFRQLFKTWVSTFKKDEFKDEWGLFI